MRLYTNNNLISYNQWGSLSDLSSLQIDWDVNNPTLYYTLIIIDIDAIQSPFLHALIINIPGNDISNGNVIASYTPPNPPINSKDHRYFIYIYQQPHRITPMLVSTRTNFDINTFISKNRLILSEMEVIVVNSNTRQYYLTESSPLVTPNPDHPLINTNSLLSESEKKYCSCVIEVAEKQPGACNLEKAWFERKDNRICANPFAVCAKSTGGSNRNCNQNYNYSEMTDSQLVAFSNLNNIPIPTPFNRSILLDTITSRYY